MNTLADKIKLANSRIPYRNIRKSFKSKHRHAYTMFILSLFTMSFFGFFALRPTLVTIATLNRQIDDSRELDRRLSEKLNTLVQAQAEYEVVVPFLTKINNAIPENPEYPSLLKDIESISESGSTNNVVSKFQLGSVELNAKDSGKIGLSVDSEGGYLSLESFIDQILSNARLLSINSLGFKSSDQDALDLKMDFEAPYVRIKEQKALSNEVEGVIIE